MQLCREAFPGSECETPTLWEALTRASEHFEGPRSLEEGSLRGPFVGSQLVVVRPEGSEKAALHLAIRTEKGCFVGPELAALGADHDSLSVEAFRLEERPGKRDVTLLLETTATSWRISGDTVSGSRTRRLTVCGVGVSGTPSCITPVELATSTFVDVPLDGDAQASGGARPNDSAAYSFLPDGRLRLSGSDGNREARLLDGVALHFP